MATLFTKIVNEDIPCNKVLESDKFLAFLDVYALKTRTCLGNTKT